MNEISTIANLGGTVFTVVAFLYFMSKQTSENIKAQMELASKLQYFGDVVKELRTTICDQSHIIKELYTQIVKDKLSVELSREGKKNPTRIRAYRKALKVSEQ